MIIYPIFIPNKGCPFKCVFCDQQQFDSVSEVPLEQLERQVAQFCQKHDNEVKQIAFFGGTFTGLHFSEKEKYTKLVTPFLDEKTSIRVSTRPDMVSLEELDWCKNNGIKTIELGIQDFSDTVLQNSKRGYTSQIAIDACLRVKQAGFELGVQLMPGLPAASNATVEYNIDCLIKILPNYLRIYPLIILDKTSLWQDYEAGLVKPLSLDEAIAVSLQLSDAAEKHGIEVIKIGIPSLGTNVKYHGPYHPAFGELVKAQRLINKIAEIYKPASTVHIAKQDLSLLTGHHSYGLKKLLNRLDLCSIKIKLDESLSKGFVKISDEVLDYEYHLNKGLNESN
jgi:histone acetyltransferase (RNA polymerase elongator complex component)